MSVRLSQVKGEHAFLSRTYEGEERSAGETPHTLNPGLDKGKWSHSEHIRSPSRGKNSQYQPDEGKTDCLHSWS
jgi:hypothetical protein